jgi:hypothetical protein
MPHSRDIRTTMAIHSAMLTTSKERSIRLNKKRDGLRLSRKAESRSAPVKLGPLCLKSIILPSWPVFF